MTERLDLGPATLIHGDALAILPTLTAPIDALVTDPPYSSGGMVRGDRMARTADKYVQSGNAQTLAHNADFTGDNRDARSWAFWMTCWLALVQERLTPGGYALVFTDWRQLPALTDAFQAGGFVWRGIVPWDKTESARAPHTGYFRHQCEYLVWGSNGPLTASAHGGPGPGLVRERVNPRDKLHLTGKPLALMGELIRCVPPGGLILDPFMGSGSTGIAAVRLGYRFIGIEKSAHYFEVARERFEREQAGGLFVPPEQGTLAGLAA